MAYDDFYDEDDDMLFDEALDIDEDFDCDCDDDSCDIDRDEDDGQPSEYEEWQDFMGGDDWDHGQYDYDDNF